jgi:hypothetical protein
MTPHRTSFPASLAWPRALWAVITHPASWLPVARFLGTVWRDFFWPQYRLRARRWLGHPDGARRVDGPVDDLIPFRPDLYPKYLTFVTLWIETLGFARRVAGRKSMQLWLRFFAEMEGLYRDAGNISREHPTTTRRPSGIRTWRMAFIKFFDPHYHCLPSLHVLLAAHTFLKFREWLPALSARGEAAARARAEHVRREMLAITESVLHVKQHSVSCIAGSLFFLSARFAAADEEFAEDFTAALFEDDPGVPAAEIRRHILGLYREFMHHWRGGVEARDVLVGYIKARPPSPPKGGDV